MAITSLNNFGVATPAGTQVLLMPKLGYRFRVTLLNFGVESAVELTKQVVSCARPTVEFEPIELPVYNSKVYLSGKHTIAEVQMVLRDDASGQVQKLVGQQIQKQFDFMEQASARSGIDYKFSTKIEILDGGNGTLEPQVLETFELYGCFLLSAEYGELSYENSDPVTVSLSIRPDNVVQFAAGSEAVSIAGGIGASVGRAIASQATTGSGRSELTNE